MRFAPPAFFVLATCFAAHVAGIVQHNIAGAQVTGATVSAETTTFSDTSASPEAIVASAAPQSPDVANSAPASPNATVINARSFKIPFTVDSSGTQPAKVQLLVGRPDADQDGSSIQWELFDEAQPDAQQFQFTATGDGVFYFTTRTIDVTGRPHPPGNRLEVVIDTAGPEIRLDADADDSGRIDLSYEVIDRSPLKEVRVQYMTDVERVWKPVVGESGNEASIAAVGKRSFTPSHAWEQAYVHLAVIDSAGNQQTSQRMVQRPRIAAVPTSRFAATPVPLSNAAQAAPYRVPSLDSQESPPTIQSHVENVQWGGPVTPTTTSSANANSRSVTVTAVPHSSGGSYENIPLPPPASPDEIANGFGLSAPDQSPPIGSGARQSTGTAQAPITPWESVEPKPINNPFVSRPKTAAEAMRPLENGPSQLTPDAAIKRDTMTAATLPAGGMPPNVEMVPPSKDVAKDPMPYSASRLAPSVPVQTQIDTRTPLRFSDSPRFSLEYELEAVGSVGVEAVELWGSLDGGQSWKRWGADPDKQSPFDIETTGEGVYAYRIVVLSASGLASPRPLPGEPADIAVVVDSTKPEVKISSAKYGDGDQIGSLVIGYSCSDKQLLPRPVALAFSETLDGPWTTIASGLRNDGSHVWPADPQLPRQFYLRIDATDKAGNVGTYVLDSPIDAQGLAPRARIRGLQSLSGTTPAAPGDQTATLPGVSLK